MYSQAENRQSQTTAATRKPRLGMKLSRRRIGGVVAVVFGRLPDRYCDAHHRAVILARTDLQGSAMQVDDSQRHRQTDSGAPRFGRETEIEDAAQMFGV